MTWLRTAATCPGAAAARAAMPASVRWASCPRRSVSQSCRSIQPRSSSRVTACESRLREERVLKDMAELGERYDVAVVTRISARAQAAAAILKEARNFAMIVMGVSARPGEELFFGETATAILREWPGATLMLAT